MRYVWAIASAVVILVVLLLSRQASQKRADFTFINRGSVNTMDPAQMSYMQDMWMARAIWEGLAGIHPETGEAVEGMAHFPPQISDGAKRYIFTLRQDARWSNGDPVTADDFARSWRRAIEPGTAETYSELISRNIAGAQGYVDWRMAVTDLLSVIRQLQKNTPIKPTQARNVLKSEQGRAFFSGLGIAPATVESLRDDAVIREQLAAIRQLQVDWRTVGDDLLDEHIRQMEEQFSQVGIRVLDQRHLQVELVRPLPYFLELTAFPTYMPVHESIERLRLRYEGRLLTEAGLVSYDSQWTKPHYHAKGYPGLISNGPYTLSDWVFKRRMLLTANPMYWNAANVKSRTIESRDVEYQNTAFMLYEQGEVDLLTDLAVEYTPELVDLVKQGQRNDIRAIPCFGTSYYVFNCRPRLWDGRLNPLSDKRVRRALSLAVDRQQLIDHVIRLDNPVATTLVPVGQLPGYRSPAGLGYDPQRARRELAEAGYPDGKGMPTLEFLYNTGFNHEVPGQVIARMWQRELNISVTLVGKETKTFAEDKDGGRFMIARSTWFGDYMDPMTFLDLFQTSNGNNITGYSNPRYDAMLIEAADQADRQSRYNAFSQAETLLTEEELPMMPLFTAMNVCTWRPNVVGIYPNPRMQYPMQFIHVEPLSR